MVFALATNGRAESEPGHSTTAVHVAGQVSSSLPQTSKRLSRDQAQVRRLERDLAAQESQRTRAAARQQQQDKAIDDLEKQLRAIKAAPAARQP